MSRFRQASQRAAGIPRQATSVAPSPEIRPGSDAFLAEATHQVRPYETLLDDGMAESPPWTRLGSNLSDKLVVSSDVPEAVGEEFRKLAIRLEQEQRERRLKVVLIASAAPGEGKTLSACNLALTLSTSLRRRVLLIDADVRRPSLHELLGIDNHDGLTHQLRDSADLPLKPLFVTSRLGIVPGGPRHPDPVALLSSERMRRAVSAAAEQFDWVLLDSPPINLLSDALAMARLADGVLLIVRANQSRHMVVRRAIDIIGRHRVVGVVFNGETASRAAYDYYSRYRQDPTNR